MKPYTFMLLSVIGDIGIINLITAGNIKLFQLQQTHHKTRLTSENTQAFSQ